MTGNTIYFRQLNDMEFSLQNEGRAERKRERKEEKEEIGGLMGGLVEAVRDRVSFPLCSFFLFVSF